MGKKKLRILFLEDAPEDAELAESELRRAGIVFALRRVQSKEEFLRGLDEFDPDLILACCSAAPVNRFAALDVAKKRRPDVPFIFVSDYIEEEGAFEALKKGATDCVFKDRLARLAPAVGRALNEAGERKKLKEAEEKFRQTALQETMLHREAVEKAMELSLKVETIKTMHEIDRSILSTLNPDDVLEVSAGMVGRLLPCEAAAIMLADNEKAAFRHSAGFGLKSLEKGSFLPFGETSAWEVVKTQRPCCLSDLNDIKSPLGFEQNLLNEGFLSLLHVPIVIKDSMAAVLTVAARRAAAFTSEHLLTLEKLAAQIGVALNNAGLLSGLRELFMSTVKSLSNAIDAKSPWTKGHSERVTSYSLLIGKEMGLSSEELEGLELAGLLHDVGKIAISDAVLDKPDKLTEEEFELVRRHPGRGAEIVAPIKQMKDIAPIIRHHHERYDGKGYPDGLKSEDIPVGARILFAADSFDAMTADRPYRPAPGKEFALSELKGCSGTQFDPDVAGAFLRVLERQE